MQDAGRSNPVCGDIYTKAFMNEEVEALEDAFKGERRSDCTPEVAPL
jgi:hypothetical protein